MTGALGFAATGALGAGMGAALGADAGADAAAEAGAEAAGAVTGAETGLAGADAAAGAAVIVGADAAGLATDAAAATGAAGVVAAPSFFRSEMFLFSSAERAAASLSVRSLAILASSVLGWTPPLLSVNLSGVGAAVFLSSTLVSTDPLALRVASAGAAAGAWLARLRRNSLKSLLCASTVWVASPAEMDVACSLLGMSITEPARMRLMLLLMKESGLLRNRATSIWSSETPSGLTAAAILPAVSPGLTVTCLVLSACAAGAVMRAGALGVAVTAGLAGAGAARGAGAGVATGAGATAMGVAGALIDALAGVLVVDWASVGAVAAGFLSAGGSNSMV